MNCKILLKSLYEIITGCCFTVLNVGFPYSETFETIKQWSEKPLRAMKKLS